MIRLNISTEKNDYISFHVKKDHVDIKRTLHRDTLCGCVCASVFVGTSDYRYHESEPREFFSPLCFVFLISCHDKAIFILELKFQSAVL